MSLRDPGYPATRTTFGRVRPLSDRESPAPALHRSVAGRIDTTSGRILDGEGFTVTRQATGKVRIAFIPPFLEAPAVSPAAEVTVGATGRLVYIVYADRGSVTLQRVTIADAAADGVLHFQAHGLQARGVR